MFVVVVRISVKPEHAAEFSEAALRNAATSVREEEHCHRFDVCQDESDPTGWLFYEVYSDRPAFDYHHAQPHFLKYNAVAQRAITAKEITTYILKNP